MALSVIVFADEADGAGLVWRAVSKVGSLISDLADVAGGCTNGQIMEYQTSNSTWICGTDDTGSGGFTNIASESVTANNATLIADNSTVANRASFKTISEGTGIDLTTNAQNIIITSTVTDTGFTNLASTGTTNSTIIATNGTSSTRATFKTISAGTGIQIDNGTDSIIIRSTVSGSGFTNIASESVTANNATLIADNSTVANRASFKTLSAGKGITLTQNDQNIVINSTIPINVLGGANLTSSSTVSYTTIFTIPLTANSGNIISAYILADSEAGTGVQIMTNVTSGSNNWGNCYYLSPTAATAIESDLLSIAQNVDDAMTTSLNSNSTVITVQCGVFSTTSPGNLQINFQTEVTNVPVYVLPGSYYIKSP